MSEQLQYDNQLTHERDLILAVFLQIRSISKMFSIIHFYKTKFD
jgi:hypothetical protein